ncbi:tyrosine-type recombinase/integrase [Cryobacterium fucosi]|nr:tyrosine-type recombinase/integrase [Cryobacterium fucosi]
MESKAILNFWTQYMRAEDLTEGTITERIRFVRNVERTAGSLLTVTRHDLIGYMASNGTWSNSTKQHYRSALHTFFTWMQDEEFRLDNPAAKLPKVKSRKRRATPLTVDDIHRLLHCGAYKRTRLMVALHYYLGLRVSEIAQVHSRDIDHTNRTLTTLGKGKKTRTLPLGDAVWELLADHTDGYLFPNWKANKRYPAHEGHILGRSVSDVIGRAMKRAGIVNHRPHDLRAATATEQSRAGVSAFVVQQNMRHERADTTAGYILVDMEQMRAGFNTLPVVPMPAHSGRRHAA